MEKPSSVRPHISFKKIGLPSRLISNLGEEYTLYFARKISVWSQQCYTGISNFQIFGL